MELSEITSVKFGIAGDADNARVSAVRVDSFELFSGTLPVDRGMYDARMGTTDNKFRCLSCGFNKKRCQGHPGDMEVPTGVDNPLMIKDVRRWLKVICLSCGTPLVNPPDVPDEDKLSEAAKSAATDYKICTNCKAVHPRIEKDTEDYFTFRYIPKNWRANPGDRPPILFPSDLSTIFGRITDETLEAFGKPPDLHPSGRAILKVIRVPENTIRPGIRGFGTAGNSYHDMTNTLQYIQKKVMEIEVKPEGPERERAIQNLRLLYHTMIIGSNTASATKRTVVSGNRPTSSVLRSLASKQGRIRKSLLGKRVFLISRSTIVGNTRMKNDEVGFPISFAREVQVREIVQEFNRERLQRYFQNGTREYPGCTVVRKRATGAVHNVNDLRSDFRLEIGDEIERDIISGDIAFFNRQPTLERSSIGVHTVKVIENPDEYTFSMNVNACDWYNADFNLVTMGVTPIARPLFI